MYEKCNITDNVNTERQQEILLFKEDNDYSNPKPLNLNMKIKFFCGGGAFDGVIVSHTGDIYLNGILGNYCFGEFTKIANVPSVKFVGCGDSYLIVIDTNNCIYGFGEDYGQFGTKHEKEKQQDNEEKNFEPIAEYLKFQKFMTFNNNIKFITCGADCVFIVTQDNKVFFGGNAECFSLEQIVISGYKEIENIPQEIEIKDLQCGHNHTIILDKNGNIYGAGKNEYGQLGMSDLKFKTSTFINLNFPYKVKQLICGMISTLLYTVNNELYFGGEKETEFKKIILPDFLQFKPFKLLTGHTEHLLIQFNDTIYRASYEVSCDFQNLNVECDKFKYYYASRLDCFIETYNDIILIESDIEINPKEDYEKISFGKKLYLQQVNHKFLDIKLVFSGDPTTENNSNKREGKDFETIENKKRKF